MFFWALFVVQWAEQSLLTPEFILMHGSFEIMGPVDPGPALKVGLRLEASAGH